VAALLLLIFVPLERLWPERAQKVWRKAFRHDVIYFFLSGTVPKLLMVIPLSMLAAAVHRLAAGGGFYGWAADLPAGVRLAAAMVVAEIGFYWGHRWSHEIPLLWRFHAIHHAAEELDWLVSTRAHPIDLVFTRLCGFVPIYVLGLARPLGSTVDWAPAVVALTGTVWGFFVHANIHWRLGWLEQIISSPGFHHRHHANDGPEVLNKNFAPLLPWVDRVFGTLYLPGHKLPVKYGTETKMAPTLAGQLFDPLGPTI